MSEIHSQERKNIEKLVGRRITGMSANTVNLSTTRSDDIEGGDRSFSTEPDTSAEQLKEEHGSMSRLLVAWLSCIAVCGCAHLGQQSADCPCDDCLPPAVAGKYSYANRLDNLLTACTAQKCAHRDLKDFDCACEDLGRDFRDGYTQAYIDLAAGRPACVPAVPPKKYWHAWHRSCGGRDAVEQWFAGYRTGLDRGVHSGVSRFNRIVPNFDSGCVSAAYVNPYAAPQTPTGILPADGQTITQLPLETESLDNRSAERGAAAPIMPVQSATFAE